MAVAWVTNPPSERPDTTALPPQKASITAAQSRA
jgi:hypothetical protein